MKVSHKIPQQNLCMNCDTSSFILTNNLGGFLFLSTTPVSKFSGLFVSYGLDVYRVLENIFPAGGAMGELENHLDHVRRTGESDSGKLVFPSGINGLQYSLAKKAKIVLDFDCRKVYDMRSFGRYYEVNVEKDRISVKFTKRTDSKEDGTHGREEFSFFIVIQAKGFDAKNDYESLDRWEEHHYSYDEERKDFPASRFVYRPFILDAKELLISVGRTMKEAEEELDKLKHHRPEERHYLTVDKKKDEDAAVAFVCAQDSLEKLKILHEGKTRIFAGLPWFFQLWSRDELISLGAPIRLGQFKVVKDILFHYIRNIGIDGRLSNRIPDAHLGCADSIGWLWKRVGDFIDALNAGRELDKYLSGKELDEVKLALCDSISVIEKNHMHDGLIFNKMNETWMDTDYNKSDIRDGACIEIQALHLNMLHLAHQLTGDAKYEKKETVMRIDVIDAFWDGALLADRAEEFAIRPNIFIAYYIYPDLLSRSEWEAVFKNSLEKLWLDWGGLSSIDKTHRLFTPDYSGIGNQSYHRGDSWFWLNNLAAVCLLRNNAIEFEDNIRKIIDASSREILWHGAIGHAAELSSASHLSSKGCFAQAWSAAMFIELIMEVYLKE
jgi:glycogen debranching enzyme